MPADRRRGATRANTRRLIPLLLALCLFGACGAEAAALDAPCTGAAAASDCPHTELAPFTETAEAQTTTPAGNGFDSLHEYTPDSDQPPPPPPEVALTAMPGMMYRSMTWVVVVMLGLGVLLLGGKAWFNARIRRADEAATQAARALLRNTKAVSSSSPAMPAPPAARPSQLGAAALAALPAARYAQLCAGFWETRSYTAEINRREDGSFGIQLRRLPDGRQTVGAVCCLQPEGDSVNADRLRRALQATGLGATELRIAMTPGKFSAEARVFGFDEAVQMLDGSELLKQLGLMSPDQQDALMAGIGLPDAASSTQQLV